MQTLLKILSEDEKNLIHERSLKILSSVGVRVDTSKGRRILADAGAEVDERNRIVRLPIHLVEEAINITPREYTLGARRPGWDLPMNAGDCYMVPDGEAVAVIDRRTGEHRPCNFQDWLEATILNDALDEIGVFWSMLQSGKRSRNIPDMVKFWISVFTNFSKHIQLAVDDERETSWFLEVLQVVFGDKKSIAKNHPVSLLLCPQSPLVIPQAQMDAYLALIGWDFPVAIMPMPLMGGTSPGSLIATIVQGNCETLATLCLLQAASPGTPILYAPVLAKMNPRSGLYSGGAVENGVLAAAATEMGRYYGFAIEASGGGTDDFVPGAQTAYERTINSILPILSWPDLLVKPGLLGSAMILSFEQLLIDAEIFKMCVYAHRGIPSDPDRWLDDVIARVGPAGNFLGQRSTVKSLRNGEWFDYQLGVHGAQNAWVEAGKPSIMEQARKRVEEILKEHKPLPLNKEILSELDLILARAVGVESN